MTDAETTTQSAAYAAALHAAGVEFDDVDTGVE